jgi:phosphoinositide-3-kinase regulatory subunit 4
VKVLIKSDPGLSLRTYHRRLKGASYSILIKLCQTFILKSLVEREALSDIANVYSYQSFAETDKAGYIIRQWLASNLYDRIRYAASLILH